MTKDKHKYDKRTTQMFNTIQKFNNNEQKIFDVKKTKGHLQKVNNTEQRVKRKRLSDKKATVRSLTIRHTMRCCLLIF